MPQRIYRKPSFKKSLPAAFAAGLLITVLLFTGMALAQMTAKRERPSNTFEEELAAFTPPEIEDIPEEEPLEDEAEPEEIEQMEQDPPRITLEQLDLALNPGTGGALSGADISMPDFSVTQKDVSMDFFSINDLDNKPRPTRMIKPEYPPALRNQGIEGRVYIRFKIDRNGNVIEATPERSDHPGFHAPAVKAVLKWKFEPGMRAGKPVPFQCLIPILFTL